MRMICVCLVGLSGLAMLKRSEAVAADQDFLAACSGRIVSVMGVHLRDVYSGSEIQYGSYGNGLGLVEFSLSSARRSNSKVTYRDKNDDGRVDVMHGDLALDNGLLPLSQTSSRFIFLGNKIVPVQKGRSWAKLPVGMDGKTLYRYSNGIWAKSGVISQDVLDARRRLWARPTPDSQGVVGTRPDEKPQAGPGKGEPTQSQQPAMPIAPLGWVDPTLDEWHFSRPESEIDWPIVHRRDEDGLQTVTIRLPTRNLQLACSKNGKVLKLRMGEEFSLTAWYPQRDSHKALRYEVKIRDQSYEDIDGDGIIDLISGVNAGLSTIRVGRLLVSNCTVDRDDKIAKTSTVPSVLYRFGAGDWIEN